MAERRRPSTNALLARKVREIEKRLRALETDKALTYAADSEVLGMDEKVRAAVGELVAVLYFHRGNAPKLVAAIGSALGKLSPAVLELLAEKGDAAAYEAVFGKED